MKNKKATYFLGFLVLAVWGIILYRVFGALKGDDEIAAPVSSGPANTKDYNDYELKMDTARLMLNYRDPFSAKKTEDSAPVPAKKTEADKPLAAPVKPVNWSFIKYSGYVRNPGTKKVVAVVNINGRAVMMAEGETADQVKLIRNMQDSIQVNFNGKTAFIKIKPAAQ